jgi:DNA-binding LytR/AlgR family response regulator
LIQKEALWVDKLRVLVCDDDAAVRKSVCALILELCARLETQAEIEVCSDGAQILEKYDGTVDFAFLDIEMPLIDGLEAARELRRRDREVCIVFMTNHEKYAIRGYEVGAWRYLLKPLERNKFFREMEVPFQQAVQKRQQKVCIKGPDGIYCIDPGQVVYMETLPNHQVAVHTRGEQLTANTSIRALEDQLSDASFFRCHTSFLINFQYVACIGSELTMKDGAVIPISRYRRNELLQRFTAYLGGKL